MHGGRWEPRKSHVELPGGSTLELGIALHLLGLGVVAGTIGMSWSAKVCM